MIEEEFFKSRFHMSIRSSSDDQHFDPTVKGTFIRSIHLSLDSLSRSVWMNLIAGRVMRSCADCVSSNSLNPTLRTFISRFRGEEYSLFDDPELCLHHPAA